MEDILLTEMRIIGGRGSGYSFSLTGLVDGFAEIDGGTISYETGTGLAPDGGVVWSDQLGPDAPATYGTGASPSDFSTNDGGALYLHVTHEERTYTRQAPIRQSVAPSSISAPVISDVPLEGETLSATAAAFDGPALTVVHSWECSVEADGPWALTGTYGLTSPMLTQGFYYRVVAKATNSRGSTVIPSQTLGPTQENRPPAVAVSVQVGTFVDPDLPITVNAGNIEDGDTLHWVLVSAASDDPSPSEVFDGKAAGGGEPVEYGAGTWPGPLVAPLRPGIPLNNYKLCIIIDNGALSNVVVSEAFEINTAAPLALPADFGVNLFRDSEHYFVARQVDPGAVGQANPNAGSTILETGAHELDAFNGTIRYVDGAIGDDSVGDGSLVGPFATLAHALGQANTSDIISLAPGIYATPTNPLDIDIALVRTGDSGDVLIGRFDDLSSAKIDPTNVTTSDGQHVCTLWNVDDISGETFVGFLRLDGAAPGGMRASAQARQNALCADYEYAGVAAVFYGGTSANFASGTTEPLPDLVAADHIRAWVQEETQSLRVTAKVYIGPGITIANNAPQTVEITATGTLILDRCEVFGGSDSTVKASAAGAVLRAFGATVGGANGDGIDYSTGTQGTEFNVKSLWPGHDETDNASTAHGNAKVLRVGGEYAGGSRTIHDVHQVQSVNVGLTVRDALFNDGTLMQIGLDAIGTPTLTHGDITYAGTYNNTLIVDSTATENDVGLTGPWPYS